MQRQFAALVRRIRDRNEWDDAFVDALCTSLVSFTFGSVITHILTVSLVRRHTWIGVLQRLHRLALVTKGTCRSDRTRCTP